MAMISIIMPLYNAQKFLGECLDSVLAQTFNDFELICINDCSTDETMDIVRNYCALDCRITTISNEEHKGAAYSRNRGIEQACGEYLLFLDGDDVFDENMLLLAYNKAIESDADIVVYRSKYVTSDYIYQRVKNKLDDTFVRRYCDQTFAISDLKPYEYLFFTSTPWDKIYKKKFIVEENLRFQDLSSCNDRYFVNMALLLAQKITYLNTDEELVYARMHDTPSRISFKREPMCAYLAEQEILKGILERGKMDLLFQHYYTKVYSHLYMLVRNTQDLDKAKEFYNFLQKDGISRLQAMDKLHYTNLNEYIKYGLNRFINECFESRWFDEDDKFQICLQYNVNNICRMFERWKAEGKKIGLWGIERNALLLLKFCFQYHLEIDQLMDRDSGKQGWKILNFPEVSFPKNGWPKVQVIIFTKKSIMEDVEKIIDYSGELVLLDSLRI